MLREQHVILAAVLGIAAIAWLYLLTMPGGVPGMDMPTMHDNASMSGMPVTAPSMDGMPSQPSMTDMATPAPSMPGMAMPLAPRRWDVTRVALTFAMWWVMMLGMMLPSAAPMILTFATLNRNRRSRGQTYVPTAIFVLGYLLAWGAFSVAATVAQWALDNVALLSPMLTIASPRIGGSMLILIGLYQFTPWKHTCLRHCRSPFAFLLNRWRDGPGGALQMGIEHGAWCLGCCWVLMALLFVAGVMNLLWVAALAVFVLAEKLLPGGPWIARAGGLAIVGFGVSLLV